MSWRATQFPLAGGLDVLGDAQPGFLLAGENFRALPEGGYRRLDGAELYDGRTVSAAAIPGAGPVRGLAVYKGELYGWRNDAGNTRLRMYKATASGWSEVGSATTITAGGEIQAVSYAFSGAAGAVRLYFINGVDNKAYQWDGATLTAITWLAGGSAAALACHQNRLWLAAAGSVQGSGLGNPTSATGGVEFGMGDAVQTLQPWRDDALLVGCANRVNMLTGASTASMAQKTITTATGAQRFIEVGGEMLALWQGGVNGIQAVQTFGDADSVSLLTRIRPRWRGFWRAIGKLNDSLGVLQDGDRTGWLLTHQAGGAPQWMRFFLPWTVSALASDDAALYFGASDGAVYRMRAGLTSFAGAPIAAYIRTVFSGLGDAQTKKRLFRFGLLMDCDAPVPLRFTVENEDVAQNPDAGMFAGHGDAGLYGTGAWGGFHWGISPAADEYACVSGVGRQFSALLFSESASLSAFTLRQAMYQFNPWSGRR
ncbi:hypothetical protein [Chitinilyticum litopenaei]|uniref:hypothetical protein n=1 Tax=Chitinilyticum litopenaei TaxID=1121276 RepID=UPI0004179AA3|nr:hypothetical protein [Chitinilyticum litopenaei]